ncbi:hypothetical protein SAMN05421642_110121 [Rhodococcoides kyotonense]|uniref:Signal transduction histidine kinase n=2 Tax=Rhodococcoides kyotonense TaxID=398843 RepID=A0A239KE00_9NOCA|nr:hypothetical protein SAMN05421642_110121 [Rhodococcus kyotonensis]
MQSRGAYAVAGLFVASAAVAVFGPSSGNTAVDCVVVALFAVGAFLVVAVPGDPLPLWATLTIVAIPSIHFTLLTSVVDESATQTQAVTTAVGGGAALCAFVCVRGRILFGWAGEIVAFGVYWYAAPHFTTAASTFVTGAGVMVMASFFAYVVRPAAASIYALREERARQVAEKAAVDAAEQERERQLLRLDDLVRPVLGRIADRTLDDASRREAVLVEATLRDSIRARALDVPGIVASARAARERGVTVQLLDDGGLDLHGPDVADEIRRAVVTQLDCTAEGSITVRILPSGRPTLAAIVVQTGDDTERYEFPAPTP